MIVGVHHIAVGVDDFGKALDFYTKALGFSIESEAEFDNALPNMASSPITRTVKARSYCRPMRNGPMGAQPSFLRT